MFSGGLVEVMMLEMKEDEMENDWNAVESPIFCIVVVVVVGTGVRNRA